MADATVREATPAEAVQVAPWFGAAGGDAARRFADGCERGEPALRVLVEGGDILAAVTARRVAAEVAGERIGLVLARGGAPESGRKNASVPILLRGVLRQYKGAAVACVTGGADPKALTKMGFTAWPAPAVRVAARSLPRVPGGARVRPAFAIDLAGLTAVRDAAAGPLRVLRGEREWDGLLNRWRTQGDGAPDAHVVLRDDDRIAYVVCRTAGDTLEVLEAAGDAAAVAGAAGALARGRGCATVAGPAVAGLADADGAETVEAEPTFGARLIETVELAGVTADPLSGVEKL